MTRVAPTSPESPTSAPLEEAAFSVRGMDCASCVSHVTKAATAVGGVRSADVNLARGRAVVRFDPARTDVTHVAAAITESGYPAAPEADAGSAQNAEEDRLHHQAEHARTWLRRAIVGIALWLPVEAIHTAYYFSSAHHHPMWLHWLGVVTSTLAILYVGRGFYVSAWNALKRRTSNMDTLIAMGASVAYVYSMVAFLGSLAGWWPMPRSLYFVEATGLLALISLGHWLEARARQSAGRAIHELLKLAPATAWKSQPNGDFAEVPVASLAIGDRLLVRPGDRVPVDGVVLEGQSTLDESMITGESLPVARTLGDTVIGGTQNIDGRLILRATKVGSQTALAQIVKLVETAQSSKPPVQKLADQVSAIFVPVVLAIALLTGIGWYIAGHAYGWSSADTWGRLANAVCSVLIIACPCALGLAVPAALMVGTGRGARRGILIRDIDALQKAEKIDTVVLDKTGTITQGKPVVRQVISLNGMTEDDVLLHAAAAEQFSAHPLAQAIVKYARSRGLKIGSLDGFNSEAGFGIVAQMGQQQIFVGSHALLQKYGLIGRTQSTESGTLVHVAVRQSADSPIELAGVISITDPVKPDSAAAIDKLKKMGLRTYVLTGDNHAVAQSIANEVGIDNVRADVKPDGKADAIRELQQDENHRVAMVGDGINDAPALAQADLGIAIGSGSDIAKETGDIVLVSGSLLGIATAIRLSRATMRTIRQNLFLAFIYNVLAIPLAAFGLLNPLVAAGAMALSDICVLGNALRLRRKNID